MKIIRIVGLICLLAVTGLSIGDNPYSVWCDYHNTYFYKKSQEYPSGVCYDVYTHTYYDATCRCNLTHKMSMKCAR